MSNKKPFLFFDIETGGTDPSAHSILSISHARGAEKASLYASPAGEISPWALQNVWKPIQARLGGATPSSEEEVLKSFLSTLQSHRGGTIAGWNIGYVASPMDKGTRGFDIPFIMSRAGKYGLGKQFEEAFSGVSIRDIGREYAVRVATEVSKYPQHVDPKLFAQASSFSRLVNTNKAVQRLNTIPEIAEWMGTPGKYGGFQVAGWKMKDIYQTMFGESISGHHLSEADVLATRRIAEEGDPSKLMGPEWVKQWNVRALANKAASMGGPGKSGSFSARAVASFRKSFGFGTNLGRAVTKLAFRNPKAFGFGALALGLYATKPLSWFSGKDDEYNTIEGLSHKGLSGRDRSKNTNFGSGYQGNKEYEKEVKQRFSFFEQALSKYGKEVGTGHKRIIIPKEALSTSQIEDVLGFVPVDIAIPEAGQETFESYRHPENLYHIHDHGKYWTMHADRNAASTMLVKRWMMARSGQLKMTLANAKEAVDTSIFTPVKEFVAGIPHVVEEGIPGAYYYLKGQLFGEESMLQRLRKEISPEYKEMIADMKRIKKQSFLSLKKASGQFNNAVFSAKDDVFNTIEGLKHGGRAEEKRRELTDFGSGWIRKALSLGISKSKVIEAGARLGLEKQVLAMPLGAKLVGSVEGSRWLLGEQIGKGGFGKVSEAFEIGTRRAGIYKEVGQAKPWDPNKVLISPAFNHAFTPGTARFQKFADEYLGPTSDALAKTSNKYGGMGAAHEATMQRLAREQHGDMVPEVYGTTKTGIFMEHAGKPIGEHEKVEALEWAQKQWYRQLDAPRSKINPPVLHLDPQINNIMKKGDQYKLLDWGAAITETLDQNAISIAKKEYEEYIQIARNERKARMLAGHKNAVVLASNNGKNGGKMHSASSSVKNKTVSARRGAAPPIVATKTVTFTK